MTLTVKPTIVALRKQLEELRRNELEKTLANLAHLGEKEKRAIDAMGSALINKILHRPTSLLKQTSNSSDGNAYVDTVRTLFDLQLETEQDPAFATSKPLTKD